MTTGTERGAALIERLQNEQPSMGLSREIARHIGWVNRGNSRKGEWFRPEDCRDGEPVLDSLHGTEYWREPPHFTGDETAAFTLMPGNNYDLHIERSRRGEKTWEHYTLWQVRIALETVEEDPDETGPVALGCANTLPMALCIAALRWITASKERQNDGVDRRAD